MWKELCFLTACVGLLGSVESLSCVPCNQLVLKPDGTSQVVNSCGPKPTNCKAGYVKDVCGCCDVCAKAEGETCGGLWGLQGKCGQGLMCHLKPGPLVAIIGTHGVCEPTNYED